MSDEQNPAQEPELAEQDTEQAQPETDVNARIEELEAQLAEAKEQVIRAAAEVQNTRRRAEQDVQKAHKFALEKFAGDLLAVVDSLERGLEVADATNETLRPMREGMQLTFKQLLDTLRRYNVERIDPHGQPFNPELHQAMSIQESTQAEPDSVLKVFQCGYSINDRLLRPAMVVVSKAPAEPPVKIDEQA
ncbi:MAG: nucleotide exchange factor GrpE [Gammaproteobacteria bacterium]|nr:nucleotide exchange factor GrpE [Gammaproteobacteria bacterium]